MGHIICQGRNIVIDFAIPPIDREISSVLLSRELYGEITSLHIPYRNELIIYTGIATLMITIVACKSTFAIRARGICGMSYDIAFRAMCAAVRGAVDLACAAIGVIARIACKRAFARRACVCGICDIAGCAMCTAVRGAFCLACAAIGMIAGVACEGAFACRACVCGIRDIAGCVMRAAV